VFQTMQSQNNLKNYTFIFYYTVISSENVWNFSFIWILAKKESFIKEQKSLSWENFSGFFMMKIEIRFGEDRMGWLSGVWWSDDWPIWWLLYFWWSFFAWWSLFLSMVDHFLKNFLSANILLLPSSPSFIINPCSHTSLNSLKPPNYKNPESREKKSYQAQKNNIIARKFH
jgi:hypothetical protein